MRFFLGLLFIGSALSLAAAADDFPPAGYAEVRSEVSPSGKFKLIHFKKDADDFSSESQVWLQGLKPGYKAQLLFTHDNRCAWLISPDEKFIAINYHDGSCLELLYVFRRDKQGVFHEIKRDFFKLAWDAMAKQFHLKEGFRLDHSYCLGDVWLSEGVLRGYISGLETRVGELSPWFFTYDANKDEFHWDTSDQNLHAFHPETTEKAE